MTKEQRQLSKLQECQILSEYSTSSMHLSEENNRKAFKSQLKTKPVDDY
jgi:hypothetical protein